MDKKMRAMKKLSLGACLPGAFLSILLVISIVSSSIVSNAQGQSLTLSPITDPLGHFEGYATPSSVSWTGDGNRISNPSFEDATLAPWILAQYNAASGSSATLTTTPYDGTRSVQLSLLSGNLTTVS